VFGTVLAGNSLPKIFDSNAQISPVPSRPRRAALAVAFVFERADVGAGGNVPAVRQQETESATP